MSNKPTKSPKATPAKSPKPRAKQIKLSHIESQQKLVNKMESYTLDEEKNLQIKYYPIYSETKIQALLTEAHKALEFTEEHNLDILNDDLAFLKYVYFLVIRHFTSLESEIPENDFPTQFHIMNQIIEIGLFNRLHDEVLPQEETSRIVERLAEFVNLVNQIGEFTQEQLKALDEQVQNPEVLSVLANNVDGVNG